MKITIKTPLISIEIEDTPFESSYAYVQHAVPSIGDSILAVTTQAIKLHLAVEQDSIKRSAKQPDT